MAWVARGGRLTVIRARQCAAPRCNVQSRCEIRPRRWARECDGERQRIGMAGEAERDQGGSGAAI